MMMDNKATVLCENNPCLMDQEVIDCVNNHGNSMWVARNYSNFWGRTLEEGLDYKLGTINPTRSVNMIVFRVTRLLFFFFFTHSLWV